MKSLPRLRELSELLSKATRCVIQRELVPWNYSRLERLAAESTPFVWDIDDAPWLSHRGVGTWLRGSVAKYIEIGSRAHAVWAGNPNLAEVISGWTSAPVHIMPTCFTYQSPPKPVARDPHLLVWIGTQSSAQHLQWFVDRVGPRLRGWRLLVVGARVNSRTLPVVCKPWSLALESHALHAARVGLYPLLKDDRFSAFKSAGKAILYLTHGLPLVASRHPSVDWVLEDGVGALLSGTEDQWVDALEQLRSDTSWDALSQAGRSLAAHQFSAPRWREWMTLELART